MRTKILRQIIIIMDKIDEENNPTEEIRTKYSIFYQIILFLQSLGLLLRKQQAPCI
jgi:hypothetical protein